MYCVDRDIKTLHDYWKHDPTISDSLGNTVAMYVAIKGYIDGLPEYWKHDSTLRNAEGRTLAMLAYGDVSSFW